MSGKRIALITGASSGIGKATAKALNSLNFGLILCGRRKEKLEELNADLGGEHLILTFDVSDEKAVFESLANRPEPFDRVDVLINNAGNAHGLASLAEGSVSDWDAMFGSNVSGLLYVTKAILPEMVAQKSGHVVNISSIAGKQTYANGTVYCATKKAVEAISEGIRLDHTKDGIKVTNIAPGAVETEFSEVRFKGDVERAKQVYAGFEPLVADDIANAIVYAVSAPDHVTIADMTILAKAQASAATIYREG